MEYHTDYLLLDEPAIISLEAFRRGGELRPDPAREICLKFERPVTKKRENLMKKHDTPQTHSKASIISIEAKRDENNLPDDNPPEPTDGNDPKTKESFWAGRTLAMRRSARWAA
jgi:hypothetical protein